MKVHNCAGYVNCQYCQDIEGLQSELTQARARIEAMQKVVEAIRPARWHPKSAVAIALSALDAGEK